MDTTGQGKWSVTRELPPACPNHILQFYDSEAFLHDVVAEFIGGGLDAGERALIIAAPTHHVLAAALRARAIDIDAARSSGELLMIDAAVMLPMVMTTTMPDETLFRAVVDGLLKQLSGEDTAPVRVYGEMADMLWRSGRREAALRLEELWDEIAESYSFSLLCAHSLSSFYDDTQGLIVEVSRRHGRINRTG